MPYLVVGLALLALGILIAKFKHPPDATAERHGAAGRSGSLWKHRHLTLGAVGIFVYVGDVPNFPLSLRWMPGT